jgi:hypothetical protein
MTALFIAWGALFLAVIGCAILDQRPICIAVGADDLLGKGMTTVSLARLPSRERGPTTVDSFYDGWRIEQVWRDRPRVASAR